MNNNSKNLTKELNEFSKNKVYGIATSAENYKQTTISIIKFLVEKLKLKGIYVTLNTPCFFLKNILKQNKIDISKLFFIDCISKHSGLTDLSHVNCSFVKGPQSLTELSLAISSALNCGDFSFLLFDSVSTLFIYNDLELTAKFLHYIINNQIRTSSVAGLFIFVEDDASKLLIATISQFCDKLITV
ncbi:hypothetical protein HYV79_01730 [Candidatus Woesearchaeota archaeon]|nr:hypothetical protein [Candidatus Woesearchaeota archaeon]